MEGFRKNYSYADFDRYYRGNISSEEKFRFEYALMEDSFLREAYEGFEEMQKDGKSPILTVNSVKELIEKKGRRIRVRKLFFVAAVIVPFVIGVLWALRWFLPTDERRPTSLQQDTLSLTHRNGGEKRVEKQAETEGVRESVLNQPALPAAPPASQNRPSIPQATKSDSAEWNRNLGITTAGRGEVFAVSPDVEVIVVSPEALASPPVVFVPDSVIRKDTLLRPGEEIPIETMRKWAEFIRKATRDKLEYDGQGAFLIPVNGKYRRATLAESDSLRTQWEQEILKKDKP